MSDSEQTPPPPKTAEWVTSREPHKGLVFIQAFDGKGRREQTTSPFDATLHRLEEIFETPIEIPTIQGATLPQVEQIIREALKRAETDTSLDGTDDQRNEQKLRAKAKLQKDLQTIKDFFDQQVDDQTRAKLATEIKYNTLTMEWLTPKNAIIDPHFLPEKALKLVAESMKISPDSIRTDVQQEFDTAIKNSDVVFCGVDHQSTISHERIADMINQLTDTTNLEIMVEYDPKLQPFIDAYLQTGKFQASDDASRYTEAYDLVRKQYEYNLDTGTFFDEHFEFADVYPILQVARTKGIKVVAIDTYHELEQLSDIEDQEDLRRDEGMFDLLSTHVRAGKKALVIEGREHVRDTDRIVEQGLPYSTGGFLLERRTEQRPSVAKLAKQAFPGRTTSFYFENYDHNKIFAEPGQSTSSILFEAAKSIVPAEQSMVALKVSEHMIPSVPNAKKTISVDYYVPIYK